MRGIFGNFLVPTPLFHFSSGDLCIGGGTGGGGGGGGMAPQEKIEKKALVIERLKKGQKD